MSSKKQQQNKKKGQKQVIANPLIQNKCSLVQNKQDEIVRCLTDVLKNIFAPNITSQMALQSIDIVTKASIVKGPKEERGKKNSAIKKAMRDSAAASGLLPPEVKSSVCIGIKNCFKSLEKRNLRFMLYDGSVNLPAVRSLTERAKVPTFGISNLSQVLKDVIGFPGLTIGFRLDSHPHFHSFLSTIEPMLRKAKQTVEEENIEPMLRKAKQTVEEEIIEPVPNEAQNSGQIVEHRKIENEPKRQIQLLRRSNESKRIFKPSSIQEVESEKDFTGNFIGFSSNKPEKSLYKRTLINLV